MYKSSFEQKWLIKRSYSDRQKIIIEWHRKEWTKNNLSCCRRPILIAIVIEQTLRMEKMSVFTSFANGTFFEWHFQTRLTPTKIKGLYVCPSLRNREWERWLQKGLLDLVRMHEFCVVCHCRGGCDERGRRVGEGSKFAWWLMQMLSTLVWLRFIIHFVNYQREREALCSARVRLLFWRQLLLMWMMSAQLVCKKDRETLLPTSAKHEQIQWERELPESWCLIQTWTLLTNTHDDQSFWFGVCVRVTMSCFIITWITGRKAAMSHAIIIEWTVWSNAYSGSRGKQSSRKQWNSCLHRFF